MRAALFNGNDLSVVNRPLRAIAVDEVLIKVAACGVCGTDIKIVAGHSAATPPVVLGHEFCGTILQVGKNVRNLSEDDFVAVDPNIFCGQCRFCRKGKINLCENLAALGVDIDGGFAEYCIVPAGRCYRIPAVVNPYHAALLEPLSCALYGFQKAEVKPGDAIVIVGGGMIGLLMLKLCRMSPAKHIIVVEPDEKRHRLLKKSGADRVINPQKDNVENEIIDITRGGAEIVIECVGSAAAVRQSYNYVKRGGRLVIFGVSPADQTWNVAPYDIFRKDLTITASFLNPFTFQTAVGLLTNGKIDFGDVEIKAFPLDEIQEAFNNQIQRRSLKTVIDLRL
ncbi:MAG: alcohol dehydrogenase [Candidatus Neomarinimicrobiota bacterium]|nr:MAG: alcohol dehydrogenase [Candidatus Neomarinimicrobiota bacterium]